MPNAIAYRDESTAAGWERTLYAFRRPKGGVTRETLLLR